MAINAQDHGDKLQNIYSMLDNLQQGIDGLRSAIEEEEGAESPDENGAIQEGSETTPPEGEEEETAGMASMMGPKKTNMKGYMAK